MSAVATPPPAPCTSTVPPGCTPELVKSMRYAVSHAVERHAAVSHDIDSGLGTTLPAGTSDLLGERPVVQLRQERAARVEGLVAAPAVRRDDGVDDDLVAVGVDAGAVAAEDHRQPVGGQAHARAGTTRRGG